MSHGPRRAGLAVTTLLQAACLMGGSPASAAEARPPAPPPRVFTAARAATPITIDGLLDEEAWSQATVIELAYEWFPGDNTPAPVKTRCLVTYDTQNLYLAFRSEDPEIGALRAHLSDRDKGFDDDTVGFMIDTFNDQRRAFQFRINPLGVQMEAANSDVDGSEDWSWDAIWDSKGRIRDGGYDVEVRLPFRSLRFPRDAGSSQTWGFMATRDYPRSTRHRLRSAWTDRDRNCVVCQMDKLTGFTEITAGNNLEIDPTITAHRTDLLEDQPNTPLDEQDFSKGNVHAEGGLTAHWGITPNLAASAAVNPDFSQVEADAAQLDINTRFALFYPEKRPFFLEGADFFGTPFQAVFTRTVSDPRAGLKLTGKEGRNAFGVFLAQDRINNLIFPSNEGSFIDTEEQRVTSGVFRYRRDVGGTSTLGALYTDREADGYYNRVGGLDGTLRVSHSDTIRFQYLFSATDYPEQIAQRDGQSRRPIEGDAFTLRYGRNTNNWSAFARYEDLDPEFRADSGFITRVDTMGGAAGITRIFHGTPGSGFDEIQISISTDRTLDHEGTLTDQGEDLVFFYQGPKQTIIQVGQAENRERFDGVTYNNSRHSLYGEMKPTGSATPWLSFNWGETIDFANSRQARFVTLSPGIEFKLGRHLRGTLEHTQHRLRVEQGELFRAGLTQANLYYHLNLRTFVRAIVQYTDIERNRHLYLQPRPDHETRFLFTQLLFSYKVNPQTVVLFGYSDGHVGFAPAHADSVDLTQTDRTVFLKIGYAFLM